MTSGSGHHCLRSIHYYLPRCTQEVLSPAGVLQTYSQRLRQELALTLTPAMRAGGKASRSARVKAFSSTRLHAASLRWLARLPNRMVVLALMPGSSSTYNPVYRILGIPQPGSITSCKGPGH